MLSTLNFSELVLKISFGGFTIFDNIQILKIRFEIFLKNMPSCYFIIDSSRISSKKYKIALRTFRVTDPQEKVDIWRNLARKE